jgi:hypothetical protein
VRKEYTQAIESGTLLAPVLLDDTPLNPVLAEFQAIDMRPLFKNHAVKGDSGEMTPPVRIDSALAPSCCGTASSMNAGDTTLAPAPTDDSPWTTSQGRERCPKCSFAYGWDGAQCKHCKYGMDRQVHGHSDGDEHLLDEAAKRLIQEIAAKFDALEVSKRGKKR